VASLNFIVIFQAEEKFNFITRNNPFYPTIISPCGNSIFRLRH